MKTEITIDTHRVLTIKRAARYRLVLCKECGGQVQVVTADEAAILAGTSSRAIYQLIEARRVHFAETADRLVLICLNSLGNLS